MQDWEWEVADATRLPEFLTTYVSGQLTDDERFSLMEIMIQCVEESEPSERFEAAWTSLEPLLAGNASLHRSTVEYWACLDSKKDEDMFRVSRRMRDLCKSPSADA